MPDLTPALWVALIAASATGFAAIGALTGQIVSRVLESRDKRAAEREHYRRIIFERRLESYTRVAEKANELLLSTFGSPAPVINERYHELTEAIGVSRLFLSVEAEVKLQALLTSLHVEGGVDEEKERARARTLAQELVSLLRSDLESHASRS